MQLSVVEAKVDFRMHMQDMRNELTFLDPNGSVRKNQESLTKGSVI